MIEWINARLVKETGAELQTCRDAEIPDRTDAEVRWAVR